MNSLSATVGDFYRYVVGVDTHAATHSYAIIEAPNGGLIDQNVFPTSPAGLRRAREWIARRTEGDLDGVLIAVEGTGSYGAVLSDVLQQVEAPWVSFRPTSSRRIGSCPRSTPPSSRQEP